MYLTGACVFAAGVTSLWINEEVNSFIRYPVYDWLQWLITVLHEKDFVTCKKSPFHARWNIIVSIIDGVLLFFRILCVSRMYFTQLIFFLNRSRTKFRLWISLAFWIKSKKIPIYLGFNVSHNNLCIPESYNHVSHPVYHWYRQWLINYLNYEKDFLRR